MSIYNIKTTDGAAAELEISDTVLTCVCAGVTRYEIPIPDIRWVEQTAHDVIRIHFLDKHLLVVQAAIRSAFCMNILDDIIKHKRRFCRVNRCLQPYKDDTRVGI